MGWVKPRTSPRNVKSLRTTLQARSPKPTKQPIPAQEEAQVAEPINWLPPLVRPRRPSTHTPKSLDGLRTYLKMPLTPGEVPVIGEPFGRLHEVKFDDHDLANLEAFPEWAPELYLHRIQENDGINIVPMHWVHGLVGSELLNLL